MLTLEPPELAFEDVVLKRQYEQDITVINDRRAPVEGSIRPGASSRYEIVPSKFRLEPGERKVFKVKLKVLRFPNTRKGIEGQRDVFHIKSSFFEQMFHSTMYLRASDSTGGDRRAARNLPLRTRPSGSKVSSSGAQRALDSRRSTGQDHAQADVIRVPTVGSGRSYERMHSPKRAKQPAPRNGAEGDGSPYNWVRRSKGQLISTVVHKRSLYGVTIKDFLIAFSTMDKDDDGLVTLPEFRLAMQRLDLGLTIQQVSMLFSNFDENSDGVIRYSEFLAALDADDSANDDDKGTQTQNQASSQQRIQQRTERKFGSLVSHQSVGPAPGDTVADSNFASLAGEGELRQQLSASEESRSILATEVASKNSQIAYLNQLVDQLQARHPKIEDAVQAAIKQQEAVMESRSQKVLSILRTKDIHIATLESELRGRVEELRELSSHLQSVTTKASVREDEVKAMLSAHERRISSLREEQAAEVEKLQAQVVHAAEENATRLHQMRAVAQKREMQIFQLMEDSSDIGVHRARELKAAFLKVVETLGGHTLTELDKGALKGSSQSTEMLNEALQRARKAEREANQLRLEGRDNKERISTLISQLARAKEQKEQADLALKASEHLDSGSKEHKLASATTVMSEEVERAQKRLTARAKSLAVQNKAYEEQIKELMIAKGSVEAQLKESERIFTQATKELQEKLGKAEAALSRNAKRKAMHKAFTVENSAEGGGNDGKAGLATTTTTTNVDGVVVDDGDDDAEKGARIASLEVEVSRLQAALKIAERTMTRSATEQLINLEAEKTSLETENARSAARAEALKEQLIHETKLAEDLRKECEDARTRLHDSETMIRTLRHRVKRLEGLQETARTTAMQSEEQLASAVQALKRSAANVQQQASEQTSHAGHEQPTENASAAKSAAMATSTQHDLAFDVDEALISALSNAREENTRVRAKFMNAQKIIHTLKNRLARQSQRTRRAGVRRRPEHSKMSEKDDDVSSTGAHLEYEKIRKMERVMEQQALQLVELRQTLVRADIGHRSTVQDLKAELLNRRERILELEHHIRNHKNDGELRRDQLERTLATLKKRSDTNAEILDIRTRLGEEQLSVARLQREVSVLQEKLEGEKKRFSTQTQELRACEKIVDSLRMKESVENLPGLSSFHLVTALAIRLEKYRKDLQTAEDNLSLARVQKMESGIPFVTDRGGGGASLTSSGKHLNTRDTLTSSLHEERVIELQKDALQHEGELALMKLSVSRLEAQLQESEIAIQLRERKMFAEEQEIHKIKEEHAIELLAQQQMHATQLNAISARTAAYSRENEILRADIIDAKFCEEHYRGLFVETSSQARKIYDFACANGVHFPIAMSAGFKQSLISDAKGDLTTKGPTEHKSSKPSELEKGSSKKLWDLEKRHLMTKLDERSTQLAILMDTVKALRDEDSEASLVFAEDHVGVNATSLPFGEHAAGLRQRVVTLTAQLSSCATSEADLENRALDLLSQVEMLAFALKEATQRGEQTQHELYASQSHCATLEEELSSSEAEIQGLREETAQAEKRARELEVALTESRGRQTAAECEARSWESQLRESRNKHFQQMRDERRELTAKILALKDEVMQVQASSATRPKKNAESGKKEGDSLLVDAIEKLQGLVVLVNKKSSGDADAGVSSWSKVILEMTNIVMESDKQRDELAREVAILSWHAKSLSEKLFSLEVSFDEASAGRMAAEQMLLDLERAHRSQQNLDAAQHEASLHGLRMRIRATERREDELIVKTRASIEQARTQELQIAQLRREEIERQRRATAMFSSCIAALSSARGVDAESMRKNVFSETDVVGMLAMLSGSPLLTRLSSAHIAYNTGCVVEGVAGHQNASEDNGIRDIVEKIRNALNGEGVIPLRPHHGRDRVEKKDAADDDIDIDLGNNDGDNGSNDDDGNESGAGNAINEGIVRELIATKVIEKRRLEEHGTLKRHCDAMRLQIFSLEDALKNSHLQIEKLQADLADNASKTATYGILQQSSSQSHSTSDVDNDAKESGNAHPPPFSPLHPFAVSIKFEREMSSCQEELREIRQRVEQKEEEIQRLSLWKAEALRREDLRNSERENVIAKAREAAQLDWQNKLQNLKKQLTAQRVEFHRKEEMLKSRLQEQAKEAELAARNVQITAGAGTIVGNGAAVPNTRASAAAQQRSKDVDSMIKKARREREAVEEENRRLMSQLAELNAELQRNEERRQIQKEAIADLQELISNVSSADAADAERTEDGAAGESVAKELIESKILISELQRKVRVISREEVRLRETILERDARIQELKKGSADDGTGVTTRALPPAQAELKISAQMQEIKALKKEVARLQAEEWKDENVFQGEGGGTEHQGDHPLLSSQRRVDPNVRMLYEKLEKAKMREKALSSNIMRVSASEMKLREKVAKLRERLRIVNGQRKAASTRANMLEGEAKSREERDSLAKEREVLHGDDNAHSGAGGDNNDDDVDDDNQPHHPHTVALQELLMDKVAVEGERDALKMQNQRLKASLEASQHKHATTARKLHEYESTRGKKSSLHFHDAQHNLMGRKRLEATVRKLSDELDAMATEKSKLLLKCERLQQHLNEVATEAASMRGKLSASAEENALERERHRREAATFSLHEGNLTALINENKSLNEARKRLAEQVADLKVKFAEANEIASQARAMETTAVVGGGSLGVVFEGGGDSASVATEERLVQQALINRLKQENKKLKDQARMQSSLMMKRLQDEKDALSEEVEQVRAESMKKLAEEKEKRKVQSRRRAESRVISMKTIDELRKKMGNADKKATALEEAKNELEALRQRFDEEHEMFEKHAEEAKAREVERMNEYERKLLTMDQKLKGEHARATSRIESISQALAAKESELEEVQARESESEIQVSKLKDSLQNLKEQLAASIAQGKVSSKKIESLATKAKALKDDLREVTHKYEAQLSAIDEKDEEIEDLRHKRQHLEQSVEDLRKRLRERSELYEKAMSEVKGKLLTSEGEADKMQFQKADALGRIEELKAHVVSLTKANKDFLADLQTSKANAAREIEASQLKVTKLTQELSEATTSIQEKEREVARLAQELEFVTAAKDKLATDAESLNERLSSTLVHDKMETEKEKEASRRASIAAKHSAQLIDVLKAEHASTKELLTSQLQTAESELKRLTKNHALLKKDNQRLQNLVNLKEADGALERLHDRLLTAETESSDLREKLLSAEERVEEMKARIKSSEKNLDLTKRSHAKDLQKVKEALEKERDVGRKQKRAAVEKTKEAEVLGGRVASLEEQLLGLQNELEILNKDQREMEVAAHALRGDLERTGPALTTEDSIPMTTIVKQTTINAATKVAVATRQDDVDALMLKVAKLQEEADNLRDRLREQEKDHRKELVRAQRENAHLSGLPTSSGQYSVGRNTQIDSAVRDAMRGAESQLHRAEQKIKDLHSELRMCKARARDYQNEKRALRVELDESIDRIQTNGRKLDQTKAKLRDAKEVAEKLRKQLRTSEAENETLKATIANEKEHFDRSISSMRKAARKLATTKDSHLKSLKQKYEAVREAFKRAVDFDARLAGRDSSTGVMPTRSKNKPRQSRRTTGGKSIATTSNIDVDEHMRLVEKLAELQARIDDFDASDSMIPNSKSRSGENKENVGALPTVAWEEAISEVKLMEARDALASKALELKETKEEVEDLRQKLRDVESFHTKAERKLERQLKSTKAKLDEANHLTQRLTAENEKIKSSWCEPKLHQRNMKALKEARTKIKDLKEDVARKGAILEDKRKEHKDDESAVQSLRDKLARLSGRSTKLEQEVERKQELIGELKERLLAAQMKKDDGGKAAVKRLQAKVEELNAALRSSNTGQRALRDQLRKLQSEDKKVKGYEVRLAEADEITEKSKIELRRCDSLLRSTRTALKKARLDLDSIKVDFEKQTKELEEARTNATKVRESMASKVEEVREVRVRIRSAVADHEEYRRNAEATISRMASTLSARLNGAKRSLSAQAAKFGAASSGRDTSGIDPATLASMLNLSETEASIILDDLGSGKRKETSSSSSISHTDALQDVAALLGSSGGVETIARRVLDAVDDEVTTRCLLRLLSTGSAAALGEDGDAMAAVAMIKAQVVAEHADYTRVIGEHRRRITRLEEKLGGRDA